jgi:hypothetical protein
MNEVLITIMLFCVTSVVITASITAVVFLVALIGEFLETHYGVKFK